jgi:hypothetical protein
MKASEYQIVCAIDHVQTAKYVTDRLADGWELYGAPYALTDKGELGKHCQAMVKYAEGN